MGSQQVVVELALDAHCDLGEGPIWDARSDTLYFVDINKQTIHAFKPSDKTHSTIQLDEPVGAVALTTDARSVLACTRRAVSLINLSDESGPSGVVRALAEIPQSHGIDTHWRFNDCKVSPQGALICGRMHSAWRKGNRGRLYSLDPGSSQLRQVISPADVGLPNGMAWSQDARTFYFVDSAAETVIAYECDNVGAPKLDGSVQGKEVLRRPTGHAHVPDGMTIDTEGNLWIAFGESGCIVCISSQTGEELQRIELPVKRPTSCAFGGKDLAELFVTTRVETGEGASEHHGGLFVIKNLGVCGAAPDFLYKL